MIPVLAQIDLSLGSNAGGVLKSYRLKQFRASVSPGSNQFEPRLKSGKGTKTYDLEGFIHGFGAGSNRFEPRLKCGKCIKSYHLKRF